MSNDSAEAVERREKKGEEAWQEELREFEAFKERQKGLHENEKLATSEILNRNCTI